MELALTNVVNVSISQAQAGAGEYNTSNLCIFSREDFDPDTFGDLGYKIYLTPTDVAEDFGTSSDTYAMAVAIFSQKPNILAGRGYLVIIPYEDTADVTEVQHIAFPTVPASGAWKLKYGASLTTGSLAFGANAATIQIALRLLAGLGSVTVTGDYTAGFDVTFTGVTGNASALSVTTNSLQDSTPVDVIPVLTTPTPGTTASTETLDEAIVRTEDLVQYFGVMTAEITSQTDMLDAAATIQSLNKIAFFVSNNPAAVAPGGLLDLLRSGGFTQSRGLFYGATDSADSLVMMASYAGRGLSVDFSGSNTTLTMHLKDLAGVQPDPSMTQTLLNLCLAAGADTYVSLQGVAKTFCSGQNQFFDQVYNVQWFAGALQIAGFNYLAQASTKIPQTEGGMSGLKNAYRRVCDQAISNQYGAPGTWNSAVTFGVLSDFLANITQRGYYIYSTPIAVQSPATRAAREAPLVQIALKEAGAIHSSNVIVNINA